MWRERTLGEVCDEVGGVIQTGPFGSQLHESDYVDDGVPVVMPKNILDGKIYTADIAFISEEDAARLHRHQMSIGDIVYGRRGDIGRRGLIGAREKGWLCGTGCLRVSLGNIVLDPTYLYYYLGQPFVVKGIANQAVGATMPNLNTGILRSVKVRYPDLPIQQRIAPVLSAYDDLIENNTRRIKILEEMAQMLYREWFVHFRFPGHEKVRMVESELGPIPEGWTPTRLGDLCSEKRRSVHPSEIDPETPYIGLEHLPRKSIALGEWGRAGDVGSMKLQFKRGEILFGKIRPYFHKVGVAPIDGVASSDAIVIVPSKEACTSAVLCCVSSDAFIQHAAQTSQGTKMPRANWGVLIKYPLPTPEFSLLESFNGAVQPIVESLQNLVFRNRNLRTTRDILLPKLISGEISVEAADEAAAELMELVGQTA